ncbi:MAG: hypothetical protein ACFFDN_52755 [Candidatus Hodarchaeota archaeon]
MELLSLIGDVWIIDKASGICLIHKNYDRSQKIDSNLFSGLLTAIINFSAEVTGGDYVKAVTMGSKKFFYNISDYFIIAVSMDLGFNEVDAKIFLGNILTSFVKFGFADKALNNQDVLVLKPFELAIDKIVQNTAKGLAVTPSDVNLSQYQAVQEIDSPEIKLKKAKIEDAIENAEWSLSMGYYKDAKIYFNIAVSLFKELAEFDMAKWCEEMIELTKMMELQTEVEAYSQREEETTQTISVETNDITKESPIYTNQVEVTKKIDKPTIKPASKESVKTPIKPKSKKYAQRRPILIKEIGEKQKLPFKDLKVLRFCDGSNSIEEICKKSKVPFIKVNEILKKYQKKKFIGIKRVI